MTTLVTGATGFVGAAVARTLAAAGETVRVLVRATSDRRNLASLEVEIAEGDLLDAASLRRAVDGCAKLYHVAADYRLWVPRPEEIYAVNVEGTTALIRAAKEAGVERIVYTSSVATLGSNADGQPADEATPVTLADMIGHYKRSKFQAEAEVRRLVAEEGAPVVIVNPSAPIGPGDVRPTPTGRMVLEAAAGKMPAYVDTGLNVVHVDDVAAGHLLADAHGRIGERYVLGGRDMLLREILETIARIAGTKPPKVRLPHNAILPVAYAAEWWARLTGAEPFVTVDGVNLAKKRMFFSSAKATAELGYQARPAEEALADAVAWFRREGYL
ncbi:MAG: NAD-dependent epimerase/dehydratase family protein [Alphaproteobacteria bacterium]|nr:NAD-dependent epimerase/dehydratase family protein [Alphaproteobacteria bacterium]